VANIIGPSMNKGGHDTSIYSM